MSEDFDNHRRIIDGGNNFQGTAAIGTVFNVEVEDAFEQPGEPADARRRTLPVSVLAWGLGSRRCRKRERFAETMSLCARTGKIDGLKRLNSYPYRPIVSHSPTTARGLKILVPVIDSIAPSGRIKMLS